MCVKIIKDNFEREYDLSQSFEDQVFGSNVVINYQPEDKEIEQFLQGMQRCVQNGIDPKITVYVNFDGYLAGFKMKKRLSKTLSDIRLNEIIKLMALSQAEFDKKLEELSNMCLNRECSGK